MLTEGMEAEINESLRKALFSHGLIGFIKCLLNEKVFEEVAREALWDLESKGIRREDLEDYLRSRADTYFFDRVGGGKRVIDYLEEYGITIDSSNLLSWDGEPIAFVGKEIIPIKGKVEKLESILQKVKELGERTGCDRLKIISRIRVGREWDPLKDLEDVRKEREFRRASITNLILDELPYVRVERGRLPFIKHVTLNPGYDEFFHGILGKYSKDEIRRVLLELERKLRGRSREKIRALRKEFERREGISRNKKLAFIAIGILATGAAGYAIYSLTHQPQRSSTTPTSTTSSKSPATHPVTQTSKMTVTTTQATAVTTSKPPEQLKIYSVKYPRKLRTNSYLLVDVNASADKVIAQVGMNGVDRNFTATRVNGLFRVRVPVKEGVYSIEKVYAFRNGRSLVKNVGVTLKAFDKPVIYAVKYYRRMKPGEEAVVKVRAGDTSGISKALMIVNTPGGKQLRINAVKQDGLYVFSFPLKKEPSYNFVIVLSDPFNQSVSYKGSITSLDNPVIHSFTIQKFPAKGLAEVKVNASDTSGIAKALIEINGKNASMVKLSNGLYAFNVSLGEDPLTLPVKVYVFDPYKQASFASGEIQWLLKDAFTYYGVEHGIPASKVLHFYNQYKSLVEQFYPSKKSDLLAPLHVYNINASLLAAANQRIKADSNIANKAKILVELSKALYDLDEKSLTDVSLSYLANLTAYLNNNPLSNFSKQQLWNVLNLTEKTPIIIRGLSGKYQLNGLDDFILTYLVNNNYKEVKDYPYLLWALAFKSGYIADLINKNSPTVLPGYHIKVKNFDIMKKYDTNHTYLELVLMRENQILNASKNGLWLIGLKPEKMLPLAGNNKLTVDLWMLKVSLPFSIISGDALKGDWIVYVYPDIYKNYPEKAALLVFADNLKAMNKMQKMFWDYQHNASLRSSINQQIINTIKDDSQLNKEGGRDLMALFINGSSYVKNSLFVERGIYITY